MPLDWIWRVAIVKQDSHFSVASEFIKNGDYATKTRHIQDGGRWQDQLLILFTAIVNVRLYYRCKYYKELTVRLCENNLVPYTCNYITYRSDKKISFYSHWNQGSQVGAVVITRASHLYDQGSSPHMGWDLSISTWLQGFFSGYSGFPPSANSTFMPRSEPSSD